MTAEIRRAIMREPSVQAARATKKRSEVVTALDILRLETEDPARLAVLDQLIEEIGTPAKKAAQSGQPASASPARPRPAADYQPHAGYADFARTAAPAYPEEEVPDAESPWEKVVRFRSERPKAAFILGFGVVCVVAAAIMALLGTAVGQADQLFVFHTMPTDLQVTIDGTEQLVPAGQPTSFPVTELIGSGKQFTIVVNTADGQPLYSRGVRWESEANDVYVFNVLGTGALEEQRIAYTSRSDVSYAGDTTIKTRDEWTGWAEIDYLFVPPPREIVTSDTKALDRRRVLSAFDGTNGFPAEPEATVAPCTDEERVQLRDYFRQHDAHLYFDVEYQLLSTSIEKFELAELYPDLQREENRSGFERERYLRFAAAFDRTEFEQLLRELPTGGDEYEAMDYINWLTVIAPEDRDGIRDYGLAKAFDLNFDQFSLHGGEYLNADQLRRYDDLLARDPKLQPAIVRQLTFHSRNNQFEQAERILALPAGVVANALATGLLWEPYLGTFLGLPGETQAEIARFWAAGRTTWNTDHRYNIPMPRPNPVWQEVFSDADRLEALRLGFEFLQFVAQISEPAHRQLLMQRDRQHWALYAQLIAANRLTMRAAAEWPAEIWPFIAEQLADYGDVRQLDSVAQAELNNRLHILLWQNRAHVPIYLSLSEAERAIYRQHWPDRDRATDEAIRWLFGQADAEWADSLLEHEDLVQKVYEHDQRDDLLAGLMEERYDRQALGRALFERNATRREQMMGELLGETDAE